MFWRAVLWVVAVAAVVLPLPAALVERLYVAAVFPPLQRLVTTVSNHAPFSLFDVLLVGVTAWFALASLSDVVAARPGRRGRALASIVVRLATVGAIAYLAFLATWGLNYRRTPLDRRLKFDASRVAPDAALALAYETVNRVNTLYEPAHHVNWPAPETLDGALAEAFARAQRDLGSPTRTVPGRPKQTLLDGYFRRAGVAGMTDPYFLETLVSTDLLPVERPMVVAHEWSHLAGIADEGEANFAGWLACIHGTAFHQYSGWLFLYGEVAGGLPRPEAGRVAAGLAEGPRQDLAAIRDRLLRHVNPAVSTLGWRVYDQYLKANRVDHGMASYAEVVRLILGTDFASDWAPRLK